VVTNAYRMAMDAYLADPERFAYRDEWLRELESVSHREYCTGYYLDDCRKESHLASSVGYIREKAYFSIALEYDETMLPEGLVAVTEQGSLARFKQKNKICVGNTAELLTPGKIGRPFVVQELYNEDGERIEAAPHPSQTVYIRVPYDVREGDILRAGEEQI
jgi:putative protease